MRIVNTELMSNPFNWIIVPLMVVFAAMLIQFLMAAAALPKT